jgi:ABC-type amino acid transport substrate-binding protein
MAGGLAATVVGVWVLFTATVDTTYRKDEALRRMHAPRREYSAIVHRDLESLSPDQALTGPRTLASLRERGTLRIGFDPGNTPLSFFNRDGELVGLDVELAAAFAHDLGLEPEFVPVRWGDLPRMLEGGLIDIMPSVWYRPFWFSSVELSEPYMMGTVGLVVRDNRRQEFARVDDLRQRRGLRIGVPLDVTQLASAVRRYFDDSGVELAPFENPLSFLEGDGPDLDAFLMPAETGAAATLLYPEFTVVVPQPDPVQLPFAFGLPLDSSELATAVNEWIVFAQSEGKTKRAYDYWVLGRGAQEKEPRWSVARNLLGWSL